MSPSGYSNSVNSASNNYIDIQLYQQLLRDGYPVERALELAMYENNPQVGTSNTVPANNAPDPATIYQSVDHEDTASISGEYQSVCPPLSEESHEPVPQSNRTWPQDQPWLHTNSIDPALLRRSPTVERLLQHRVRPTLLPELAPQPIQPLPRQPATTPGRPTSPLPAYTFTPTLPIPGTVVPANSPASASTSTPTSSSSPPQFSSSPPPLPTTYAGRRSAEARAHFPFQCNICDKRYLFQNSIHKHWRARHKKEWGEKPLMTVAEGAEKRPPQGEPRNKAAEEARKRKSDGAGKGSKPKKEDDDGEEQEEERK